MHRGIVQWALGEVSPLLGSRQRKGLFSKKKKKDRCVFSYPTRNELIIPLISCNSLGFERKIKIVVVHRFACEILEMVVLLIGRLFVRTKPV
jgi:hypothetical protein